MYSLILVAVYNRSIYLFTLYLGLNFKVIFNSSKLFFISVFEPHFPTTYTALAPIFQQHISCNQSKPEISVEPNNLPLVLVVIVIYSTPLSVEPNILTLMIPLF